MRLHIPIITIRPDGYFELHGLIYASKSLKEMAGQSVRVLYETTTIKWVTVVSLDYRYICTATERTLCLT